MSTGRSASAPWKPAAATPTTVNAWSVDVDRGPDSIRGRGEESSRRSVAQNRDTGIGRRPIVSRCEQPPRASSYAENLKEVAGDDLSREPYGLAADPHGHSRIGDASNVPDSSARRLEVEEIRIRHHPESIVDRCTGHADQLACVLDRRRFQQQDVENREDGHVQPNTEGKRDDGNDGKAGAAEQHTGGVADVGKCEHKCGPRSGASERPATLVEGM
jgi:hypothetical protein